MRPASFRPCPLIRSAELRFTKGIPTFVLTCTDGGEMRELLRGTFVDVEVLERDPGLAYCVTLPDRRTLLAEVKLPRERLDEIARGAGILNVCPTLIAAPDGEPIDLRAFVMDVDHDWTGVHARAKTSYLTGRAERALQLLRPLLDKAEVGLARAFHLQARCFAALGNQLAAVTCYQSAIERATETASRRLLPAASTFLSDAGAAYLALGDLAKGRAALRRSLHLRPNNPEALFMYAGTSGDVDLIVHALARVSRIGCHDAFVERFANDIARATGQSAKQLLDRAAREDVDPDAWEHVADESLADVDAFLAEIDADPVESAPLEPPTERSSRFYAKDAVAKESPEAKAKKRRVSPNGGRRVLRLLWHLAACDGHVDPAERATIGKWRARLNVPEAEAAALEAEGCAGKKLELGAREDERRLLVDAMVEVAAADGVLVEDEEERLHEVAREVGIPTGTIDAALQARLAKVAGGGAAEPAAETANGLRRVYRALVHLASSDGSVGPQERAFLDAWREKHAIAAEEARLLEEQGRAGKDLKLGKREGERALLLESMIALVAADGILAPEEERRVLRLARAVGIEDAEVARRLRAAFAEQDAPEAPAGDGATLLFLSLPGKTLEVDLTRVPVESGFRGFAGVPAGVHRVAVEAGGRDAPLWLTLAPGELRLLAFGAGGWEEPDGAAAKRYRELVATGALGTALAPFPRQLAWEALAEPLRAVPVTLHPLGGASLERAWKGTHGGDSGALLAEVAFAFLEGVVGGKSEARRHWLDLVQAIYHCEEALPASDPALFVRLVELLVAQQSRLPREAFVAGTPVTSGSHLLAKALSATGVPELVAAGERWAVFCSGHHAGAPDAVAVAEAPRPVEGPFAEALGTWTRELSAAEERHGEDAPELLPILFKLGGGQELAGDVAGAVRSQERVVSIASRGGRLDASDLARAYGRLARLYRRAGRGREADAAAARARALG